MNGLSWNCRGLGRPHAVLELKDLVQKHSPQFVFLMKTKAKDKFLKNFCRKLDLKNLFIVPRNNTGGGLALYWKEGLNLKVQSSSPSHIDAIVDPGVDDA